MKPRVERGGINENNNNNGFSFIVASPLEVRANFHNFTARLRSFARSPATQASNPDIVRPSLALTMRCVIGDLLVNTEPTVFIVPGDVFAPVFGQEESIKRPLSSLDLGCLFQLIEVACSDVA